MSSKLHVIYMSSNNIRHPNIVRHSEHGFVRVAQSPRDTFK